MLEELFNAEEAKRLSERVNIKKDNTIEEEAWNEAVQNIKKAVNNGENCAYTYKFSMTSALKKKLEELGYKVSTDRLLRAMSRIIW
jgi:predicted adenine nucleotide alpha hydrolase (AANH) superfamily ATPase